MARRSALVLVACAAIALVVAFVGWQVALRDKVVGDVRVAGVSLDGLSSQEASAKLRNELGSKLSTIRFDVGQREAISMPLAQIGVSLDAEKTASAAVGHGRRRLLGLGVWLPFTGGAVDPVLRIDRAQFDEALKTVREAVDTPARDARLDPRGEWGIVVIPARDGKVIDEAALVAAVKTAAAQGKTFSGPPPTKPVAAKVSTAIAEERARAARPYFARPIVIRQGQRATVLPPAEIGRLVAVNLGADADTYPLTFRNGAAAKRLRVLLRWAERPARDAEINVERSGAVTVSASREGEAIDMQYLLEDLDAAAIDKGARTVHLTTSLTRPRFTEDDVENLGLAALGAQFTTYFDTSNKARAVNIARAAKLVDGTIVEPGDVFSLNETMGPRTVNRGFDFAPVIAADGVLREGVGGGICQYATTLFNAALYAGLPIVDRRPHSFYISHYPVGRDATVAWGAIDFMFRNDTHQKLLIRSWVKGGGLTVAIIGRTGRRVELSTGPFVNLRRPAHGKKNPRVIRDADLGPGIVRWEEGVDGRTVKITRTVRDERGGVIARDAFSSTYKPLDWVKRVGVR